MNSNAIVQVSIIIMLIIGAVIAGNVLFKVFFGFSVYELPLIGKFLVHGLTLGLIFMVIKKFFN